MLLQFYILFIFCTAVHSDFAVPKYEINLDKSPEDRWTEVIQDHRQYAHAMRDMARQWVPKLLEPLAWKLGQFVARYFPQELMQEIQGIAKHGDVSLGEIVWINLLYDISAFDRSRILKVCTSIVAEDPKGLIWHGRNLDFDMQPLLRNLTILAAFTRNGKVIFEAPTFAYYVGVLTGQRPHAFSISLNERYSGPLIDNILMALYTRVANPAGFLTRQVLTVARDFNEAVKYLSTKKMMAPCYFIVAGMKTGQGVIISRNRWQAADVWTLNATQSRWFILETNYDHWRAPPDRDHRRYEAQKMMKQMGKNGLGANALYKVLSTYPILNGNTIFTTIMNPSKPDVMANHTIVRTYNDDNHSD